MKRLLSVGINKYQNPRQNLRGCLRDSNNISRVLTEIFSFNESRLLLNSSATKSNILDSIHTLVSSSKEGDTAVFHFSGHGCKSLNRQEADMYDECLVSYDHSWRDPLTDDDLREVLSTHKPGVTLILFIDSCYSGGLDDALESRVTFHPPEIKDSLATLSEESKVNTFGRRDTDTHKQRHILITGSGSNTASEERRFGRRHIQGVFTTMLCRNLRHGRFRHPNTFTWHQLYNRLRKNVSKITRTRQIPTIACSDDSLYSLVLPQS